MEINKTEQKHVVDRNRRRHLGGLSLTMKYSLICRMVLILFILISLSEAQENEFSLLKGPYLGLEPPGRTPEVFARGLVSIDESAEYGAHFSPDLAECYFTRNSPSTRAAIWVSAETDGHWSEPRTVEFMDAYRGSESCISPDGQCIFYVWINRTSATAEIDFYKAERTKGGWSTPSRLTNVDLGERRISPSVASNGNLYFSGNYDNPDQKDIYFSKFIENKYSTPINLGKKVNSEYHESHVYVSPDESYLLFDSNRPNKNGKTDIYISFKTEDNSWGEAQNIGSPVNSEYSDWYPTVTPDGKYLMFSRNVEGLADIMWVDARIIKDLKPKQGSNE